MLFGEIGETTKVNLSYYAQHNNSVRRELHKEKLEPSAQLHQILISSKSDELERKMERMIERA